MVRAVTDEDTGLRILHEPANDTARADTQIVDIVAIHGIGAHPDDTWCKNVGTKETPRWANWLFEDDMLPAVAPNARIMRYGYQSQWFGKDAMRQNVSVVARRLLLALQRKREEYPFRPLIFIAHCFGGLVVLKALLDTRHDPDEWPGVFVSTTGLLFFGTPFRGAEGLSLVEMLEAARSEYHHDEVQADILKVLEPGNEFLQEIVDQFGKTRKLPNKASVACFYELMSSNVGSIVGKKDRTRFVVNQSSGCLDLSEGVAKFSLSRTHFNMNKFGTPTEEDFETVSGVVKDMIRSSYDLISARYQYNYKAGYDIQQVLMISNLISQEALVQPLLDQIHTRYMNEYLSHVPRNVLHNYLVGVETAISDLRGRPLDSINQDPSPWMPRSAGSRTSLVTKQVSRSRTIPKVAEERSKLSTFPTTDALSSQGSIVDFEWQSSSAKLASWLWNLGLCGSVVRRKGYKTQSFSVSIRYRPPAVWNRRSFIVLVDFALRFTSDLWKISTLHFNLMPLNIIPANATIIQACKYGYLEQARKLFRAKKASTYDITSTNYSLLYFAIEGGHLELVRLLLDEGADVNQTFGQNQTSPLQWALYLGMYDITRLLLDRSADGAHISCYGWNAVVYLLEGAQKFEGARDYTLPEFLDILNHDKVHIDTDTQDGSGQNALQLAAAWYHGGVIERLFTLGASLSLFGDNPWSYPANPISNAIYSNNTSTFQVLLRHYPDIDAVNQYQLRMLNYTARNCNIEMTELLLEMGAEEIFPEYNIQDDENNSRPDNTDDADGTTLLRQWTEESYLAYLDILERFGRIAIRTDDTNDGVNRDIYWNANEDPRHWDS